MPILTYVRLFEWLFFINSPFANDHPFYLLGPSTFDLIKKTYSGLNQNWVSILKRFLSCENDWVHENYWQIADKLSYIFSVMMMDFWQKVTDIWKILKSRLITNFPQKITLFQNKPVFIQYKPVLIRNYQKCFQNLDKIDFLLVVK